MAKHSVSVAGIVVNDSGHVLVIQRRDNARWEPPGGVLELDESVEDGVTREVFEETGLHIRVNRLTGIYKNMSRGVVALVFRCAPLDQPNDESIEAMAVRWVMPHEIASLMDPAYAVRVIDALRPSGDIPIRAHDGVKLLVPSS